MERMCSNIAEESIKTDLVASSLRSSNLKDSRSDPKSSVSSDNFGTCDPFCKLTALTRCEFCAGS
jgi:hypothetical protein